MIKIENAAVSGWEAAIRGMRNPMNSWSRSDSMYRASKNAFILEFVVGGQDLDLMKQLVKAGSDHSKFMRMINVTLDVTAPMYWWKEMDTYKVGTVRNSCSTMHKVTAKEFEADDFSHDHLPENNAVLGYIVSVLNIYRKNYLETQDKAWWWQIIQILPSSYNQRATLQLNYAVLRNIYHSRKNHKLDEWHDFCHWVESLPNSELITL
jgi:hypothetical protein